MSESFERALERLLHDQSPSAELPYLDAEEQAMLRMAQVLRGSSPAEARPVFVDELRERVTAPPGFPAHSISDDGWRTGCRPSGWTGAGALSHFRPNERPEDGRLRTMASRHHPCGPAGWCSSRLQSRQPAGLPHQPIRPGQCPVTHLHPYGLPARLQPQGSRTALSLPRRGI